MLFSFLVRSCYMFLKVIYKHIILVTGWLWFVVAYVDALIHFHSAHRRPTLETALGLPVYWRSGSMELITIKSPTKINCWSPFFCFVCVSIGIGMWLVQCKSERSFQSYMISNFLFAAASLNSKRRPWRNGKHFFSYPRCDEMNGRLKWAIVTNESPLLFN